MKKFMKWVKGGNIPKSVMSDNSVSSEIKKEEIERYDTASQVCHHHNNEQYPNIKAIEHCEDCNTKMCYMCGSKHMVLGHNVKCKFKVKLRANRVPVLRKFVSSGF